MRKAILLVLLGAGTVFGFAHGVHTWRHHGAYADGQCWHSPWADYRAERMDEFARACVKAAHQGPTDAPPASTAP
jgi:hypothetical protein